MHAGKATKTIVDRQILHARRAVIATLAEERRFAGTIRSLDHPRCNYPQPAQMRSRGRADQQRQGSATRRRSASRANGGAPTLRCAQALLQESCILCSRGRNQAQDRGDAGEKRNPRWITRPPVECTRSRKRQLAAPILARYFRRSKDQARGASPLKQAPQQARTQFSASSGEDPARASSPSTGADGIHVPVGGAREKQDCATIISHTPQPRRRTATSRT